MTRRRSLIASLAALCSLPAGARADTPEGLVGAWSLVAADLRHDGYRVQSFGADPSGTLLLTADGHYAVIFLRRDQPQLASHDRTAERTEQAQVLAQGSVAHFGTYAVEGDMLVFHILGGTYANANGTRQRRRFSLAGDVLTYSVPDPTGLPIEVTLHRSR